MRPLRYLSTRRLARACREGFGAFAQSLVAEPPATQASSSPTGAPTGGAHPDSASVRQTLPSMAAGGAASSHVEDSAAPRLGVLEQRLAGVSERLELLSQRVDRLALGGSPTLGAKLSSGRAAHLPAAVSHAAVDTALDPAERGTLRPPPVPRELSARAEAPLESGFEAGARRRHSPPGPTLTGTLSGMSLTALFGLFELERCSGVLSLCNGSHEIELTLHEGTVTRTELDGARIAAARAVGEAFEWECCTFAFRRDEVDTDGQVPQSVNALVLEAMRQHDERGRLG